MPPFTHWLRQGRAARVTPTPHFDPALYADLYPDVAKSGAWAFEHFLRHGVFEHRSPNRVFDSRWYASLRPDDPRLPPFVDYVSRQTAAAPSAAISALVASAPQTEDTRAAALQLDLAARRSGLDREDLALCIDLVLAGREGGVQGDPAALRQLVDLLETGLARGRTPTPLFDAAFYRRSCADVGLEAGGEGATFLHWLKIGRRRGLIFSPFFDEDFYRQNGPGWLEPWDPFEHFLRRGVVEGRAPNPLFDASWYRGQTGVRPGLAPFLDYLRFGAPRGRLPSALAGELLSCVHAPADRQGVGPLGLAMQAAVSAGVVSVADIRLTAAILVSVDAEGRALAPAVGLRRCLEDGPPSSPTPLFDVVLYRSLAEAAGIVADVAPATEFLHWLQHGRFHGLVPTHLFDARFYEHAYSDLGPAPSRNFDHFLVNGVRERRDPSPWFHSHWYAHRYDCPPNERPYYSFLVSGMAAGHLPCPGLQVLMQRYGEEAEGLSAESFTRLNVATARLAEGFTQDQLHALMLMFEAGSYRLAAGLEPDVAAVEALAHFLETGLAANLSPSPFFDPAVYGAELDRLGIGPPALGRSAFRHWLTVGRPARITPTRAFDEGHYLAAYNDIAAAGIWAFEHFVSHGLHEGRLPSALLDIPTGGAGHKNAAAATIARVFPDLFSASLEADPASGGLAANVRASKALIDSAAFQAIVRQAQVLEPAIGDVRGITTVLHAPHHDPRHPALEAIRALLPSGGCDFVLCVPWVRMGGADYVGSSIAQALRRLQPKAKVIVLQTDSSTRDWMDWYPDPAMVIDISGPLQSCGPEHAEFLLYTVLMGLAPVGVINVNSGTAWRALSRYGARLRTSMKLWSYLFCWDQTAEGARVGYPSRFFAETVGLLDGTLTDTAYLRDELIRIYQVPQVYADRIIRVPSPATLRALDPPIAERRRGGAAGRRKVVWAGRFDRQKRFDIVVAVARAMPDTDFDAWGAAVIGDGGPVSDLPPNLRMRGAFKTYDDLDLEAADGWLYTAAWDGLPTILIELAMLGVAVTASAVGGVPELIKVETGWPVAAFDDPAAYVAALRDMLDGPEEERSRRARALQARVMARHTAGAFDVALAAVLARERVL